MSCPSTPMPSDIRAKLLTQWVRESEDAPGNYLGYAPCEIQWDRKCQGRAVEGHEPILRSRGGSTVDRANVLLTCRHCHDAVHHYPSEATSRGFMRSASDPA